MYKKIVNLKIGKTVEYVYLAVEKDKAL